ncbi:sarcosine oxidase subunit gamma [Thalassococcus sp. S3]|uniref:sarcosine oxidase subunit gamma n=1 Tax=Thalassococcus sp. S3 TaxID=2017482 RepID=UPI0010247348|nr:sarcosine oxidase subunit gamma family protein [Thalassococcus sp. S3]QBF33269.1 sarcosine oxidase subunit gamma [Thalassococcus sp. S3]
MSDAISACPGASFDGLALVEEAGLQGMITLRGDLGAAKIVAAATKVTGADMPGPGEARFSGDHGLCWMSPDELLILCPYAEVTAMLSRLTEALSGIYALAVNVSDARARFTIRGPHAPEVLAKLCPVDLSPDAFAPGQFRRTRMAQVPAAFWMSDTATFQIVCFRSVAQYVFDLLKTAAHPNSKVDAFRAENSI